MKLFRTAGLALGLALAPAAADAKLNARAMGPSAARKYDFSFRSANIQNVLRMMAETAGVNVVIPDHVQGKVTLVLRQVRWVDAVNAVLASHQLDGRLEGTILYVDTLENWAKQDELALQRAQTTEALAPLVTRIIPVSNARAAELAPLVKALLSPRGRVAVDERTNSLIVTDVEASANRAGRRISGR